ncbi:major capsid protein [Dipodfec virus UOA04_Rod_841]|nr:major capsid protein [Dipodfec virus UOA04_Rod_841]
MSNIRIPQDYKEDVNYSVHDLSREKRSTIHAGLNIPIYFKKMYPGDKFTLNLASLIQSNPMLSPLMGRYKLRTNVFFEPLSNLYGWLDNNKQLSTEELLNRRHHTFNIGDFVRFTSDSNDVYYSPASDLSDVLGSVIPAGSSAMPGTARGGILDYVGVAPGFVCMDDDSGDAYGSELCLDKVLAYLDIIRTYYVNRQEKTIPFVSYPLSQSPGQKPFEFSFSHYEHSKLDDLFMWLRNQPDGVTFGRSFGSTVTEGSPEGDFYDYLHKILYGSFSGLFCAMYEPDYFMNYLSSDVGKVKSVIRPGDQGISMHEFYFQNKLQRLIDRYDVSGGIFSNWIRSVWGVRSSKNMDVPDLIGSLSTFVDTSNITTVSNTVVGEDGSPAGEIYGNVNQFDSKRNNPGKKFDFYVDAGDDEGYCVVIVSLIPLPDYSENIEPDLLRTSFADDYKPQLAQLGFQDVRAGDFSVLPTTDDDGFITFPGETTVDSSEVSSSDIVAKQIAWFDLMTDTNRVHGEFSNFGYYDYWVLRRRFRKYDAKEILSGKLSAQSSSVFDMSRYINPLDWQYPFVGTSLFDPNFFLQFSFDIKAVRPIGKRFMPSM